MKLTHNGKGIVRLCLFLLLFGLFLVFASLNLIETDLLSGRTLQDLRARDDIEIAFVGSSVTVYHMNPEIVTRETGLTAFDCAIHSISFPGAMVLTEEMFKTSHPKYVVLVLEPYNLDSAKESEEAEFRVMPFLKDPRQQLDYYLATAALDNEYLERALIMRTMYPKSLRGIIKTHDTKKNATKAMEKYKDRLDPEETYMGSGFVRHNATKAKFEEELRVKMYRDYSEGDYYPLLKQTKVQIDAYRELVESHGSELIFIICPNHTSHALAIPSFLPYTQSLMRYCSEKGIPLFNFQFATPELMPCLDEYYFDIYHMCGEGADIFTSAFCRVFNAWKDGEDVSSLFYYNDWTYLDRLHALTNTWVWPDGDHFRADCNIDQHSTPEYRFLYVDENGNETLLRDYAEDPLISFDLPETGNLRVYARIVGEEQQPHVYYDYPKDFYFAKRFLALDGEEDE